MLSDSNGSITPQMLIYRLRFPGTLMSGTNDHRLFNRATIRIGRYSRKVVAEKNALLSFLFKESPHSAPSHQSNRAMSQFTGRPCPFPYLTGGVSSLIGAIHRVRHGISVPRSDRSFLRVGLIEQNAGGWRRQQWAVDDRPPFRFARQFSLSFFLRFVQTENRLFPILVLFSSSSIGLLSVDHSYFFSL